jgi:hypothetical protein
MVKVSNVTVEINKPDGFDGKLQDALNFDVISQHKNKIHNSLACRKWKQNCLVGLLPQRYIIPREPQATGAGYIQDPRSEILNKIYLQQGTGVGYTRGTWLLGYTRLQYTVYMSIILLHTWYGRMRSRFSLLTNLCLQSVCSTQVA